MISAKRTYTLLAVSTFFLIITGQFLWSTIHGDGAVYAWVIREITEKGIFSAQLPTWSYNEAFAEHPYLFFFFSFIFTKLMGFSDLVLKLPNFVVAAFSIFAVYKVCTIRNTERDEAHQIGLVATYALIFNSVYNMQISQPSLDPLAQLLGFVAVALFIFFKRSFIAGLLLGLAALTKGVEIAPHLAAFFLLTCYLNFKTKKMLFKTLFYFLIGLLIPILLWLAFDHFVWRGQWLVTYWNRQFVNRFFKKDNMEAAFSFNFLLTFIRSYFCEILVLAIGLFKSKLWSRKKDPLFFYFAVYVFFNVLAFLIIKKDSSQHVTGILLLGSVFVGEYLWELWHQTKWKNFKLVPIVLFALSLSYWIWFMINSNKNPDLWTLLKHEGQLFAKSENNHLPIVIDADPIEYYGLYYTTQWYFRPTRMYSKKEATTLLAGQKAIVLRQTPDGQLNSEKVIYGQPLSRQ